jgi:Domain of unknown function (DUF1735)
MKKNNFKYLTTFAACFSAVIILLSSCIKSRDGYTDFSNLKPIVQIPEGGFKNFGKAALSFPASNLIDSVEFYVNYASTNVAEADVTITLGYDEAALNAYNADGANKIKYEKMPDSLYMFTTTKVIVKKGNNYAGPIKFYVYSNKVDPTKNYMFPLSIKDAQGNNISGNFGTIYYHMIGNPLAGNYLWSYYRWNGTTDTTTAPNSTVATNVPLAVFPINPTSVFLQEYYIGVNFGQTTYGTTLEFENNSGTPINFSTIFDSKSLDVLSNASFSTPTNGPKLVKAILVGNAATNYKGTTFRTYTEFINSAGAVRAMIDNYVKQ